MGHFGTKIKNTAVRAWMEQGLAMPMIIRSMEMQLQAAEDQVYGLASPSGLLASVVQASPAREAAFVRALERKEATGKAVSEKLARCMLLKDQLVQSINRYTSGRENCVLTMRYVAAKPWEKIAGEIDLSSKQVQRICYAAMEKIVLPEDAVWIDAGESVV